MPWRMGYLSDQRVVELQFSGAVTQAELKDCVVATLEEGRLRDTKHYLCDAVELSGGHTIFELFALAENLYALGMPPGMREAVVLPARAERAEEALFWETVCANRGFEVRCFPDRAKALAWLTAAALPLTGT